MLMFQQLPDVYLHRDAVDFRKSINGLTVIVEQHMALSPIDGSLFVFCNKSHDKLKILYWDTTGFALWYKRLEQAKFKWPTKIKNNNMSLSEQELHWLLSGYDVLGHQPVQVLNYS
ncbi:IS66 family insertion sequence element accessory protein TnpB [Shewanella sp. D64]|uniref:IS66 family insertion sequence element accessory protein TnpB n=1 Tax=unclassified Shewanella TaxID=196818 RepID=UPI0022BA3292|nr:MULTISPECIES: IS66 family insertion sequence element accessory protein TnpB [unclassified Shewanella]MEC4728957.1 IS66 family insertion sequence element accessory protein TnpB [Shewanella sp. D64]MEC4740812.1 IS66 family insertion sequence element accessory protein TnpB [Shewanella sp. E94]WBJ96694.1 IS66 family insertion sequence element accessory protein TnpB [Shewanella sp. MTB7]